MPWLEVSFNATDEAVDWVRTLLSTSDYISGMDVTKYPAIASDTPESWAFTIRFYLPHDSYANTRIDKIENLLSSLHRTGMTSELEVAIVAEKQINQTIPETRIHRIGQRFVIKSLDAEYQPELPNEIIIKLKETLSFGSGLHPATILSLRLLEELVLPGINALDLGSGSGILSVAIAKLGGQVLALDNDPIAVQATQAAVIENDVEAQVRIMKGSLGQGSQMGHWMGLNALDDVPAVEPATTFDLIVANILGRMHLALISDYQKSLCQSDRLGLLITSGYTTDYEDEINSALATVGFEVIQKERINEWVAMAHRLKAQTAQA